MGMLRTAQVILGMSCFGLLWISHPAFHVAVSTRRELANHVMVQAKAEALPAEPVTGGSEPTVTCAVRFPDGTRVQRRFLCACSLTCLFGWVDSLGAGGQDPDQYRLVSQFPRQVLEANVPSQTFADAGLTQQQAFLLEPWKASEQQQ